MATGTAFYIDRLATTRIGWPPNTAPAMVDLRLRHPQHHPPCGWQQRMATTASIFHFRELYLCCLTASSQFINWWFTLNYLSLNPDKLEAINIGTGARQRSEVSLEVIDLGHIHN